MTECSKVSALSPSQEQDTESQEGRAGPQPSEMLTGFHAALLKR